MHRRLVFALVLFSTLVAAPEAAARIDGDCQARIADQDVTSRETGAFSDAIEVDRNDLAAVTMSADQPIQRLKVELEFAGVRWAPLRPLPAGGDVHPLVLSSRPESLYCSSVERSTTTVRQTPHIRD